MKKVLVILIASIMLMFCSACSLPERKTPYGWCMWEIEKHEQYEEFDIFGWDFQEVMSSESNGRAKCYIITVMSNEPINDDIAFDYWFCFIEYKYNPFWEGITREQITAIDCDWFKTEYIGSSGTIIDWRDWED